MKGREGREEKGSTEKGKEEKERKGKEQTRKRRETERETEEEGKEEAFTSDHRTFFLFKNLVGFVVGRDRLALEEMKRMRCHPRVMEEGWNV